MPSTASSNRIQDLGSCRRDRAVPQSCPVRSRGDSGSSACSPFHSAGSCDRTPRTSSSCNPGWLCPHSCTSSPGKPFTPVGVSLLPRPKTGSQSILLYVGQVPKEAHGRGYRFPSPNLTWDSRVSKRPPWQGASLWLSTPPHLKNHSSPSVG